MALIFDDAFRILEENRQRATQGLYNTIPFQFRRMNMYVPGIQRRNYVIITASSGVGKSKFAKVAYVLAPYNFVKSNPGNGIKLKIFYFCLEESKVSFIHSIICYKLMADHGLRVHAKQLQSMLEDEQEGNIQPVDLAVLERVRQMREWFEEFEQTVEIIDDIRNPSGMYFKVKDYLLAHGHWETQRETIDGRPVERRVRFVHHHPQHYIGLIADHLGFMHTEKNAPTLHEAISRFSSTYAVELRDKYGCWITAIQQQAADTEKQQYTYRGQSIEAKLEPSLSGLGDNKLTQRDANEVFGLFAPDRYEITTHRGYDVSALQDNYRSFIILKSRDGTSNVRLGMFFDGASNVFEELPKATTMTQADYDGYLQRVDRWREGQRTINFR